VLSVVGVDGVSKSAPEPNARWRCLRATSGSTGDREKLLSDEVQVPVPQTDTGRRVENTKANGRTLVKELGKMAP
jgi:hypothetical protein